MPAKLYWIKKRDNPQLGTYFVAMGIMSKARAKKCERPLYGSNEMRSYETEKKYQAEIKRLESLGHKVM